MTALKAVSSLRLPELVDRLDPIAGSIVMSAEEREQAAQVGEDLAAVRSIADRQRESITELNRQIEADQRKLRELQEKEPALQEQLKHALIVPGKHVVKKGAAIAVLNNEAFLGLESVYPSGRHQPSGQDRRLTGRYNFGHTLAYEDGDFSSRRGL